MKIIRHNFCKSFIGGHLCGPYRSSRPEVFLRKDVLKMCSNVTGEHSCRSMIKSHFGMGVLLWICCIFSEPFFLRTPLHGCSYPYFIWKDTCNSWFHWPTFITLHDGDSYYIEPSPLIYRADQWTGFCMIGTSVHCFDW